MPRDVYKRKRKKTLPVIPAKAWRMLNQGVPIKKTDMVNHPPHYTKGKFETINVIEDIIQFYPAHEAYSVGNVLRYISRAMHKGNKQEDLEKAQFYLDRLVGHPGKGGQQ